MLDASAFSGIVTLSGGAGNDELLGGEYGINNLSGGAGNDYLNGGNDDRDTIIESGNVNFVLTDTSLTGLGNDTLSSIESANLTGGSGNNVLDASAFSGDVTLSGGVGNDTFKGGSRAFFDFDAISESGNVNFVLTDTSLTGLGNDTLSSIEVVYLTGGSGNNVLDASAFSSFTSLYGGAGNDELLGGEGNDNLYGREGNDFLVGGAGEDFLYEEEDGNDTLVGGAGDDNLVGGAGDDNLVGGAGNDSLDGESVSYSETGNDSLDGGVGDDQLSGGAGNDELLGGEGNDNLYGDYYSFEAGNDTLDGGTGNDELDGREGNDTLYGGDGIDTLRGREGNDYLYSEEGNDYLGGGYGNDTLTGGAGNDRLAGGGGNDSLTGGGDADQFRYSTGKAFTTADVGVDLINDFIPGLDTILLDKTTFTAIGSAPGTGFSNASEFAVVGSNSAAQTSLADIVYNSTNGNLFYNQNGSAAGFGTGAQFATLTGAPGLSGTDFIIQA